MHDPFINRSLLLAGLVFLAVPLTACNTIEGAGEDVENVGEAGAEVGEEAGEEIGEEAGEID
ncbi:entericidin A/B family lipoprotein [Dongia deserti]|uniref:entericidin A/B family lipoprotein n=1 Tax=Dongia deserti TaxID=2268030 RepID=UPI000E646626|nr:entericidin A/B family lipoprotein [Dongia deserti]